MENGATTTYEQLMQQYEALYGKHPIERMAAIEESLVELMQDTVQWYLGRANEFEFKRLVAEIRSFRDLLAMYQWLIEGIDLTDHPVEWEHHSTGLMG